MWQFPTTQYLILLLAISVFNIQTASAQTGIAVYDIKGLHNADHTGGYDRILLEAAKQGVDLKLNHTPIIRAKHLFHTKQIDCISPSDPSEDAFPFPSIQSTPLNMAKAYIFTREEDGVISNLNELKGKPVGIRKGLEFGSKLEKYQLNLEPVWDTEQNYKKLMNERIDAFIAYIPDIWGYFDDQQIPYTVYDKNKPIVAYQESVACHDTPANNAFIKQLNYALQKLKESGFFKQALGNAYNLD